MAIGTSITPRSYNVDTTGRDYVLDPDPLLDVAQRSFASQRENLRMVGEVAQQGVSVAEYIGARQQLGRVKAQLGDLDVNDPMFAQKYSSIVAENPLAFINEKIAPVTKAAITPVLASAAQAMESAAALERAKVMAGYQRQAAATRYGYQTGLVDYKNDNPAPARPRQPGLGERLLFGEDILATPPAAAPTQGVPDQPTQTTGGVDVPQLPTNSDPSAVGNGPNLLDPYYPPPAGAPFSPEDDGLVEGQGDGAAAAPPNIRNTQVGPMRIKSVGEGVTLEPYVDAVPARDVPEGFMDVPGEINPETGTAATRRVVEKPQKPAAVIAAEQAQLQTLIDNDPVVASSRSKAAILASKVDALTKSAAVMSPEEKEKMAPEIAAAVVEEAEARQLSVIAENAAKLKRAAATNPQVADELLAQRNAERRQEEMDSVLLYGPPQTGSEVAAPGAPTPPAPPTAREVIAARRNEESGQNQKWTEAKTFAVSEASRVDAALGLPDGSLLRAASKNDAADLDAITKEAQRRGVTSPLFKQSKLPAWGPAGTITTARPSQFSSSPLVKRSYKEVLREAAKEVLPSKGAGEGFKWNRK